MIGHWQKEIPPKPGLYYIRTLDGEDAGVVRVSLDIAGKPFASKFLSAQCEWKGWWWSEPLPTIPPFDRGEK